MKTAKTGEWVEIENVLLSPEQRAPQVPDDTKNTPYVMRVAGFLTAGAQLGEQAEIRTLSGRLVKGTLSTIRPHYTHSFGETVEELLDIGLGGKL
jgi:hypothetical protein